MAGNSENRNNAQNAVQEKHSLTIGTQYIGHSDGALCYRFASLDRKSVV